MSSSPLRFVRRSTATEAVALTTNGLNVIPPVRPERSERRERSRRAPRGRRGFTLVETAIALGILSISIAALMNGAYLATDTKQDVRKVTRATLLAKAVMAEIEWKLQKDGFGAFEKTEGCDFKLEGLKEFACDYTVKKVELPIGDMIQKLMSFGGGGLAGAAGGGSSSGSGTSTSTSGPSPAMPTGLAGLAGMAGGPGGLSALAGGAAGMGGMAGGLAGGLGGNALQLYASQMQTMLEEALREVRLTISWKTGRKSWDSLSVVTHMVEIGRAGVSAQDQMSGQISRQFGLQAPVPGQQGGMNPGGMMPPGGGGFTGSPPPLPPTVTPYMPGSK